MKTEFLTSFTAAILLAGFASNLPAQTTVYPASSVGYAAAAPGSFYFNGDLGANFLQDMTIKGGGPRISYDPGFRGDVAFGYQFSPPVSVEFETGVTWNNLTDSSAAFFGATTRDSGLYQIPFLANLVFNCPLQRGVSVYGGLGAGGIASELDLREIVAPDVHRHFYDTDFTFAYQAMAGMKFAIASNMDLGFAYKFLGTLDHSWFQDIPALATRTGPAYNHSLVATFTIRF